MFETYQRVFSPSLPQRRFESPCCPPAPLSPSSGGLAGQSDRERGGRPLCTASLIGVPSSLGVFPFECFKPVSLGCIGQRRGPYPLRCPWWITARVGTGRGTLKSCLWCWILAPGLGSCVPLLRSSWWQGRRGSSGSWRWWSGFMVEGSAASPVALWCRPWWSGLEVAGLVASSAVFRSDPASLLLAGRSWRRGAGGSGGRGGFSLFLGGSTRPRRSGMASGGLLLYNHVSLEGRGRRCWSWRWCPLLITLSVCTV
jgi:hypothetical protein